jgi:hypothetical protein
MIRITVVSLACFLLSGCFEAHTGVTDVCINAFKPISFVCRDPRTVDGVLVSCGADSDTPQTVIEIRENNAVYEALKSAQ